MKKTPLSSSTIRERIARLSVHGRALFVFFIAVFIFGVLGALITLSNRFTTVIPQYGGTYREGIVGVPRFINPVLATSDADKDLTALVYSGLVRKGPTGEMIPDLATSWTISPDGLTYTFTMRQGTTFQNGSPVTPADVIFTVQQIQDSTIKSPLRVAWDGVSVASPDAHTVVFTLQKPYAGFMQQLDLGILPSALWSAVPDDAWDTNALNVKPIGSGPYKVVSVSRDDSGIPSSFHLNAFAKFDLGKPHIASVVIDTFANNVDAYSALSSNSIDGLAMVDSSDIDQSDLRSHTIITKSLPRVFALFFNPSKNPIFADQTVVKALNLATDKQSLINQIFQGYGTALNGPLPESVDTGTTDFATKQALAESLLDKDGWKMDPTTGFRVKTTTTSSGSGKKKTTSSTSQTLAFTLSTANTADLEQSAQLLADQYKAIGVDVTVKVFEIGTLNEDSIRGRDFEALLFGQVIQNDTDIFAFWDSSQRTAPGLNITGYTDKLVDSLLAQAIAEPDHDKRFALYQQISDELAENAPVVFLYTPDAIMMMSKRVENPIMPPISAPSDRFSLIYQWYLYTDRVWDIFLKH